MKFNDSFAQVEPLAVPALQGFRIIGVGVTKGYTLINNNELESYLDGCRRMITLESCRAYVARKLADGQKKRDVKSRRKPKASEEMVAT